MPKYLAKADGHLGKTIVKIQRGKKTLHDAHILAGDIFQYDGVAGTWMEEVSVDDNGEVVAPVPDELARKQAVMSRLNELGVKYFKGATTAKLEEQLAQAEASK